MPSPAPSNKVPSTAVGGHLTATSERRMGRYGRYIRASGRLDRVVLSTRLSPNRPSGSLDTACTTVRLCKATSVAVSLSPRLE